MDAPKKWLIALLHLAVDLFVMANIFTSFLSLDPDIHNAWNLVVIPLACLGLDFLFGMIAAAKFHVVQACVWPVLAVTSPHTVASDLYHNQGWLCQTVDHQRCEAADFVCRKVFREALFQPPLSKRMRMAIA